RLIRRNRKSLVDDLASAFRRRITVLPRRGQRGWCLRRSALLFAFSDAQSFLCAMDELIARRNFIDQTELRSYLSRIKFPFQTHVSSFFGTDQAGQARATAPCGN